MSVYLFVASLEEEMKLKEVPLCESSPADKNRTERGVRLSGTVFTYYVQDPGLGHWGRGEDRGRERERGEGDYSQPPADGFNARPLVTLCFSTNEEV